MIAAPYIDIHTHKRGRIADGIISVQNVFAGDFNLQNVEDYCSVGLHPWFIRPESLCNDLENVESAAQLKNVIAIGETGLDRAIAIPIEKQEEIFEKQLQIAAKYHKPAIIHAVKAYPDIIACYKNSGVQVPLIFHGFSGNRQIAEQLLNRGFYLSFGEDLFKSKNKASAILRSISRKSVFLETDESDKSIAEIYYKAAAILSMKSDVLKSQIHQNFLNCFGAL